ncbi:diguanylate cyclase [Trinickia terrae]|uniref:diguanylate cyclase n=2 Tax=Trinickia terrae TaxID=2571161 RepID=A0A4U1IDV3_9BURK|nr:diguanylate cyclase [Trinickia terrae]
MDRRFCIHVGIALAPIVVLSCWLLAHEWTAFSGANLALRSFDSVRSALFAMEKVSAERGPSNGALGEDLPLPAARAAALDAARRESDRRLAALVDALRRNGCPRCDDDAGAIEALEADLAAARANIDRLLRLPLARRGDRALSEAVDQMIAIVPEFLPIVAARTSDIVAADPYTLNSLILAKLAADLREQAGQLGSHFTSALAMNRALAEDERFALERGEGRIEQLRSMINSRLVAHADVNPQAAAALNDEYYGDGLRYVDAVRLLADRPGGAGLTTARFAAQYVPTMRSITGLRDSALGHAEDALRAHRRHALGILAGTAAGVALLLVALIWAIARFRQQVVSPFVKATALIEAIADGDLTTEVPTSFRRHEIRGMFDAIAVLKHHSAERARLERERASLMEELATMAQTDPLTHLLNRRAFETRARALCAEAQAAGDPVAMIMFDIDHFKHINDTHGHAAGDDALRTVAELCRKHWRQSDVVARIGGEEFAVAARVSAGGDAFALAERLRRGIAEAAVPADGAPVCKVTASFGVALASARDEADVAQLLKRADHVLYQAKLAGRNCVVVDPGSPALDGSARSPSVVS